jgi:polyisoprenyl-phosphate glycosyltransferase
MSSVDKTRQPIALSVVAPCFNESEGLTPFYRRVTAVCREAAPTSYEIVLVNDGSTDDTWAKIRTLAREDPHVVGVNLSRNHGHQLALTAGLSQCAGARILVLDADLQDPPELLPSMMELMDAGVDVVFGKRRSRRGESRFKLFTASLFYRLLHSLTDVDIPLDTGDFRLMNRAVLNALMSMPEQHRFIRGMVSWLGFTQAGVEYDRDERVAGETKYPFHRMLRLAIDAITGFSIQPLRAASYLGLLFGLAGLALLGYSLMMWFANQTVRGWTSLISVVLLMGSVQILLLGILGEYVGRLFVESKRRPLFIIRDIVGREHEARPWRPTARTFGSGVVALVPPHDEAASCAPVSRAVG